MDTPTTPADRNAQIEANFRELGRLAGVSADQIREGWEQAQPHIAAAGWTIAGMVPLALVPRSR